MVTKHVTGFCTQTELMISHFYHYVTGCFCSEDCTTGRSLVQGDYKEPLNDNFIKFCSLSLTV